MARSGSPNLTYRIVQDLGIAIVSGKYSNEPFPIEAQLSKQFGASRTVLREAVKMLTAKGLLSARPRYGTTVQPEENWNLFDPDVLGWLLERKISLPLLREFAQVRRVAEPEAAALAAIHASPEDKAELRAIIERMQIEGEIDPLASDIAFHVAILRASKNRFFSQLCIVTETALRFSIRMTNEFKGVRRANVDDHRRIADAICAGDPNAAETAMRELIEEALSLIEAAEAQVRSGHHLRSSTWERQNKRVG